MSTNRRRRYFQRAMATQFGLYFATAGGAYAVGKGQLANRNAVLQRWVAFGVSGAVVAIGACDYEVHEAGMGAA